jgi:hypothetical protein
VRALDGVSVNVPRFTDLYQKRVRILGRNLLVKDSDPEGRVLLRLYDVHTGQDLWKQTYPANSTVLKTEDTLLTGVVDPNGTVTVIDLHERKEVCKMSVSREHITKLQDGHLLQDAEKYYVVLNLPVDPQVAPFGGPTPNVQWGLRAVMANGWTYAFDRRTGKVGWYSQLQNQMLVLDRFQDLPFVLFTARFNEPIGGPVNRGANQVVLVRSIDKRTGKLVFDKKYSGTNNQQFYALNLNQRERTIELIGYNMKVLFSLEGVEKVGAANQANDGAVAGNAPVEPVQVLEAPVRRIRAVPRVIQIQAAPPVQRLPVPDPGR